MESLLEQAGNATSWNNHLPLLWFALEETQTGKVVELGMGDGSTQWLRNYCSKRNRELISYDNDIFWFNKHKHDGALFIRDWDRIETTGVTVVLVDHAPGERRVADALKYKQNNAIIVCHDTEAPPCGGNYKWHEAFKEYRYKATIKGDSADGVHNGIWATALSNHYNLTKWIGMRVGKYTIVEY